MNKVINELLDFVTNNKKIFAILLVLGVGVIVGIELFNRGSYSNEEIGDSIVLSCPDEASAGDEIDCGIILNSSSIVSNGLSSKYSYDQGDGTLLFKNFSVSDGFTIENGDDIKELGFVLVNLDGVSGSVNVGTVKVMVPTDAVVDDVYKLGLVDATIGNGTDKVELEDVYEEIKISSNDSSSPSSENTLEGISLNGTLIDGFNKNDYEYTTEFNSNKVTISVTKTNDDLSVTGDGEKVLHYGTNTFSIVVTGSDETSSTYTLNIYRPYNFSTDTYIYNAEDNYLYTGTDTDEDVIKNNIVLENGLSKKIENNKLVISYNNENLLEIDVLNISFRNVNMNDKDIIVNTGTTSDNLKNNINITGLLTYKIYARDLEVNSTDILRDGMVLKIYYKNELIDSYRIMVLYTDTEFNLTFDSNLDIDEDNKYINYIIGNTVVEELLSMVMVISGDVKVTDVDGEEKGDTSILVTGDKLVVSNDDGVFAEYIISVKGDVSGDGKVNLIDLVQLRKHLVKWEDPVTNDIFNKSGVYYKAMDLDKDDKIGLIDLVRLRKILVGIE